MLEIRDLHARAVDEDGAPGKDILRGLTLTVAAGEVVAIMGPNGAGKSTLAHLLSGKPGYEITSGDILYKGESLLGMAPEERARRGIFLAFQYPVEIPGVNNMYFLRASLNAIRKHKGESELNAGQFLKIVKAKLKELHMPDDLLQRPVNVGFSGGEKKRNEIFHMSILQPSLCLLDETDSGLDIDALKAVADGVNALRSPDRAVIMITHYQRLLDHIVPDQVHVLADGRIVRSGDKSLALDLEREGYALVAADRQAAA